MRELVTPRLLLRRWRLADRAPFAALNADPVVRRYFPNTLGPGESDALADSIEAAFAEHGFGLWAVEERGGEPFLGFVGLSVAPDDLPFVPPGERAVEIGWRLAREHHGKGYATEAARAALRDGFERVGLREVVSFTAAVNAPSIRVMERIGMTRDPDGDFDHPRVPAGSELRRHVLFRIRSGAHT